MLQPKRTKFRKAHKGRIHGLAKGGFSLAFGGFGLKVLEPERVTARQIEAARRAITRAMKRQGRVWIRIFPDVPVSTKPAEVRMGSGKGSPEYWVARVKPGRIMFEVDGVPTDTAREALTLGAAKLPIRTKVVERLGGAAEAAGGFGEAGGCKAVLRKPGQQRAHAHPVVAPVLVARVGDHLQPARRHDDTEVLPR